MGLDMYLYKTKRVTVDGNDLFKLDPETVKETDPNLYEKVKQFEIPMSIGSYKYQSFRKEVAYWRKVNHIHNWFVEHVQNGIDDCGCYEVTKEHIDSLMILCKSVLKNRPSASANLPTRGGFFFGSTDYDNYYFEDIKYTIKMLRSLKKFDYDNYVLSYQSSW